MYVFVGGGLREFSVDTCKFFFNRDAERQKKTNMILADLQGQQHDVNMFKKMTNPTQRQRKGKH